MKTLADIKRRLTPGTTVQAVNHLHPHLSGERVAVKVQTNSIAWSIPGEDSRLSWLNWPKAAGIRIDGPDTVTFLCKTREGGYDGDLLTIIFTDESEAC